MIIRYLGASIKSIIGTLELCQSHSIKISKWKLSMLGGKLRQRFRVSLLILCKNMENFQFSLSDLTSCLVSMSWFVAESQQDCSVIWKQFDVLRFSFFGSPRHSILYRRDGLYYTTHNIYLTRHLIIIETGNLCQPSIDGLRWLTRPDQTWPELCSSDRVLVTIKRYWLLLLPPTLSVCRILMITSL